MIDETVIITIGIAIAWFAAGVVVHSAYINWRYPIVKIYKLTRKTRSYNEVCEDIMKGWK